MRKTIRLGKVDFHGHGRKDCLATVEYELTDAGSFTMSAAMRSRFSRWSVSATTGSRLIPR